MSNTDVEAAASTDRRPGRGRKVRAMLAGGLVLGVGAAITLAAWTDSEFATGTFAAGTFDLEGSTTSATAGFADHETADAAAELAFTLDLTSNLSPTDVTYAPFWVRLDDTTTSPASLDLTAISSVDGDPADVTTPGNVANLSWTVVELAAGDACDADGVAAGTELGTGGTLAAADLTGGATVDLAIGATAAEAGAAAPLCFAVTAGPGLVEGGVATATWQFLATSL